MFFFFTKTSASATSAVSGGVQLVGKYNTKPLSGLCLGPEGYPFDLEINDEGDLKLKNKHNI